ncbi:MAG: manganese efflux pump MntP family protein [Proteobacteria bacterium]|nr:manganese efflux pump MntP family protein [Pseudomonadota bacterium]MBU1639545.1 manganese efflux pump MntP family protein [Pseudomonadota bacterium]
MNLLSIFLIAIGLAMDAFAVSIACGVSIKNLNIRHILLISGAFGFFQGFMPLVGWFAGMGFRDLIASFDHWVAFGLLLVVGGKMIYESFALSEDTPESDIALNASRLLLLSIATSIDALAVGLTFACLEVEIITPALIIGLVTLVLSIIGVVIGDKIGHLFEGKIEFVGGMVLIGIGTKILFDHLGLFGFSL